MARPAVLQYWLIKLRSQADLLPSLKYLQTDFMGLSSSHPIFRLCGPSPWEVEKAISQARLLSGRYRVEALSGHWTPGNRDGLCTLPACWQTPSSHVGTVETFLLSCSSLSHTRNALEHSTVQFFQKSSILETLVPLCIASDPVQFYLDCSTMPAVISAVQAHGEALLASLLKLTRNYCHVLHKARSDMLDSAGVKILFLKFKIYLVLHCIMYISYIVLTLWQFMLITWAGQIIKID